MDFRVEAVKYIITEQCQRVSTNNRENAYCVEYTGKGWKISPADREHLCWSEGDNTFYLEPKPSERTEEFIASCRYPESETAIAIAKKLIQRHEKQEYTTWSFRMLKDRNNDNKTLDIIRDKLNGSCYEDYDDDSNIDKRVKEIEGLAKETGVVIVYGHSDDLIEFRGAIDDELGAWEGGIFLIHNSAHPNVEKLDSTDLYRLSIEERRNCIFAKWPWHYKTDIPHKEFTVFYDKPEDDEKEWAEIYCSGIIFSVKDLA